MTKGGQKILRGAREALTYAEAEARAARRVIVRTIVQGVARRVDAADARAADQLAHPEKYSVVARFTREEAAHLAAHVATGDTIETYLLRRTSYRPKPARKPRRKALPAGSPTK